MTMTAETQPETTEDFTDEELIDALGAGDDSSAVEPAGEASAATEEAGPSETLTEAADAVEPNTDDASDTGVEGDDDETVSVSRKDLESLMEQLEQSAGSLPAEEQPVSAAQETPAEKPAEAPIVEPSPSLLSEFKVPKIELTDDQFEAAATNKTAFAETVGNIVEQAIGSYTQTLIPAMMRQYQEAFGGMWEAAHEVERITEKHPAIEGHEALLAKTITEVRAKNPTDTIRQISDKVIEKLSSVSNIRRELLKSKAVDARPKGRFGSVGTKARASRPKPPGQGQEEDPTASALTDIAEFEEMTYGG